MGGSEGDARATKPKRATRANEGDAKQGHKNRGKMFLPQP